MSQLGYLSIEKDFPEQLTPYHTKRRETIKNHQKNKKSKMSVILKRG